MRLRLFEVADAASSTGTCGASAKSGMTVLERDVAKVRDEITELKRYERSCGGRAKGNIERALRLTLGRARGSTGRRGKPGRLHDLSDARMCATATELRLIAVA